MCLRIGNPMTGGSYRGDPLGSREREEFERDLIAFCDRELDLLGDIRDLEVLYAGGSSLLWLEGLSERIGEGGSLRSEEHTSELQSRQYLVCRLLLEKKKKAWIIKHQ